MESSRTHFATVDEYIKSFPQNVQEILEKLRDLIKKEAPEAKESISYGIPAYHMQGRLIYFAAFPNHVSIYPITAGLAAAFTEELAPYSSGKATIRFPLDKPIPYDFVQKIVTFRIKENAENEEKKKQ